jgi:hypothetical protein
VIFKGTNLISFTGSNACEVTGISPCDKISQKVPAKIKILHYVSNIVGNCNFHIMFSNDSHSFIYFFLNLNHAHLKIKRYSNFHLSSILKMLIKNVGLNSSIFTFSFITPIEKKAIVGSWTVFPMMYHRNIGQHLYVVP